MGEDAIPNFCLDVGGPRQTHSATPTNELITQALTFVWIMAFSDSGGVGSDQQTVAGVCGAAAEQGGGRTTRRPQFDTSAG